MTRKTSPALEGREQLSHHETKSVSNKQLIWWILTREMCSKLNVGFNALETISGNDGILQNLHQEGINAHKRT